MTEQRTEGPVTADETRRQMRSLIRVAISDAYYEARNDGETMESAADAAASGVWTVLEGFDVTELRDALDLPEEARHDPQ